MALSYNQTAAYDVSGNILSRNDVGTYVYGETCDLNGQTFAPGPHAVTSVSGVRNASYCYDGGGNMVSGDGRTISYTSFNKPDQIETANATVGFVYGPSRGILKTITSSGTGSVTKYSFGAFEKIIKTEQGQTSTRERFSLPGGAVVSFEDGQESSKKEEYLISDAIGSVIATVNALGGVSERYQYDPWGRPRAALNWESITDLAWNQINRNETSTNKGFSGHEMLDEVGLIHMGGRVYDPTIGRFLSADPVVKGLENTESYNRYSYVLNSPLSFTDPSGYSWLSKTWKKLERSFKKYFREIAMVFVPQLAMAEAATRYGGKELARFAARNKFAGEVIGLVGLGACTALTAGSATGACVVGYQALTSGSMTYASGGSLSDALTAGLKSGALAYVDIAASNKIASWKIENSLLSGGAHAARGGAIARLAGGNVRSGIVGGFTEGALGGRIAEATQRSRGAGAALAGLVSGTVSEVTGGKFAAGAVTGAMGYLFNQMSKDSEQLRAQLAEEFIASIDEARRLGVEGDVVGYIERVRSGGRWDFKSKPDYRGLEGIEDFGNFAYGATASAWVDGRTGGISTRYPDITTNILMRGAGAYQEFFQHYNPSDGHFFDFAPPARSNYGDQFRDQMNIHQGAKYYYDRHAGR
ncbi:RHS repeat-associated core domain-containing protein [Alcanivorax quisquiliarum]|uniref:Teneurin-like YD-shell domain-containing protein n=1 Tax=Alcanivorax quisquiliarum TaxID=2933565 RepID=A0ABT0E4U2_9GAMM|nr:RHS repeat-associated core domain-containing protein [Alcanivorax quisquiliarum]MCK0536836.1 hypothetical protein [Alcanivorax quisquiliarum]